jgi:hypothetical protein
MGALGEGGGTSGDMFGAGAAWKFCWSGSTPGAERGGAAPARDGASGRAGSSVRRRRVRRVRPLSARPSQRGGSAAAAARRRAHARARSRLRADVPAAPPPPSRPPCTDPAALRTELWLAPSHRGQGQSARARAWARAAGARAPSRPIARPARPHPWPHPPSPPPVPTAPAAPHWSGRRRGLPALPGAGRPPPPPAARRPPPRPARGAGARGAAAVRAARGGGRRKPAARRRPRPFPSVASPTGNRCGARGRPRGRRAAGEGAVVGQQPGRGRRPQTRPPRRPSPPRRATGHNGEAQQRHPEPALQEEVAVPRADLVQPARAQGPPARR